MNLVARSILLALMAAGCSTRATPRAGSPPGGRVPPVDPGAAVLVALVANATHTIGATTEFAWHERDGAVLSRGRPGEQWRVERQRGRDRVRAIRSDGQATAWAPAVVASVSGDGFVTVNAARFRGRIVVVPHADTLVVVNRVPLEEYLRSVVAAEMGNRPAQDSSALMAQAVAARSYAVLRMGNRERPFDVYSTVLDQAYRGVDLENQRATTAVERTRGLVLFHGGRVADAVYSSTCGGTTAEASEVWAGTVAPYLQRVSDRVEGTDRYYCDIAPRFRWTRDMVGSELSANLALYLARYATVPAGGPGRARQLMITEQTPSGRAGTLMVETDRGTFPLRGNQIRFVMRSPGGEILNSTYFSVETERGADGYVTRVTFRGQGYGHGIGMCQWGAIGRSRAGQSFRSILATYYPGTSLGSVQ